LALSRRAFLQGTAAVGGLAALGPTVGGVGLPKPLPLPGLPQPTNAPIDTIVVVMMENRSFDHYLGWLPGGTQTATYLDSAGQPHTTRLWAPDYKGCGHTDPGHGWDAGRVQLGGEARDGSGFIKTGSGNDDFALGYYGPNDIPVWAALTRQATIFNQYYCALLGSTYPNREYQHAATSGGRTSNDFPTNPIAGFGDETIWDRCTAKGVSWAYYYSNLPVIGLYGARLAVTNVDKIRHISAYYADALAGRLPQVCFVDPFFTVEGLANDDHPFADIRLGQQFLSDVICAFTHSPQWERGAMFVNYDEWGGFFDTAVPQPAPDDDRKSAVLDQDFSQRGFRTPASVISPFARRGTIASQTYDHTSILRFIEWRYGLGTLTRRDATARNIGEVLDFTSPNYEREVVPAYVAPLDARVVCALGGGFESDLAKLQTTGLTDALGLRTDWRFEDSYRSF
jgi:phospholipase C